MAAYQMILAAAFLATSMAVYLQVFGRRRVPTAYVFAFYCFGAGFGLAAAQFWPNAWNLVTLAVAAVITGEVVVFASIVRDHDVPFPPGRFPEAADPVDEVADADADRGRDRHEGESTTDDK